MDTDQERPPSENLAQIEFWNGRPGEIWARNQEKFDRIFSPLTQVLTDQVAPASRERVLDIGCGCGDLALALAARMSAKAHILGVDVSKPMLERARQRGKGLVGEHADLAWLEADASTHAFSADYDLLISRFGVMFFADPLEAFGNLYRALKPGGRLAILCWRDIEHNPWFGLPLAQIQDLVGPQQPATPLTPGPFGFADPSRVCAMLVQAGFAACTAKSVDAPLCLGRAGAPAAADANAQAVADALDISLRVGPVAAFLREADDAAKIEVRSRVETLFASIVIAGEISLGSACWLYTGHKPAA